MKRCLNCRKPYDENLTECPHCGYKARSKAKGGVPQTTQEINIVSSSPPEQRSTVSKSSRNVSSVGAARKNSFYLQSGDRLNKRYSIVNVIGFGSFGVAYECFDNNTKRRVVVKEYIPSYLVSRASNGIDVEPLTTEAGIKFSHGCDAFIEQAKKLSDNGIHCMPKMLEYFHENNTSYIVTELVDGELLSSIIKRKGVLSYQSTVSIITSVLQGLRQINKLGVIHSDICPYNIVVTSPSSTKLLDYNLSDFNKTIYTQRDSGKLRSGYSALEMYYTEMQQGPWTDVYAAAATMYKMLTGVTLPSAISRNTKECMTLPSAMGAHITPGVEKALVNALKVDYEKRTQNPEDFLNGLTGDGFDNLSEDKHKEQASPVPSRKKKPKDGNIVLNTILIFLIIAIVAVAVWLFISGVFILPDFITEKLGLNKPDSDDNDTDRITSSQVTSVDDYETGFHSREDETDSDVKDESSSRNPLDDLLSNFFEGSSSEEEDFPSYEPEDEYSYDDSYDESSSFAESYYDDYSEVTSSDVFDDFASAVTSGLGDIVSGAGDYINSWLQDYY